MYKGTVEWFDSEKGLGTIIREDGTPFNVHCSSIRNEEIKTLLKGEQVVFDIGRGEKGIEAIYVLLPGDVMKINRCCIASN